METKNIIEIAKEWEEGKRYVAIDDIKKELDKTFADLIQESGAGNRVPISYIACKVAEIFEPSLNGKKEDKGKC